HPPSRRPPPVRRPHRPPCPPAGPSSPPQSTCPNRPLVSRPAAPTLPAYSAVWKPPSSRWPGVTPKRNTPPPQGKFTMSFGKTRTGRSRHDNTHLQRAGNDRLSYAPLEAGEDGRSEGKLSLYATHYPLRVHLQP